MSSKEKTMSIAVPEFQALYDLYLAIWKIDDFVKINGMAHKKTPKLLGKAVRAFDQVSKIYEKG